MANLKDIKVGDRVWISNRYGSNRAQILTVVRLTPTQIHLGDYKAKYKRGVPSRHGGEPSYWRIGSLGGAITSIATEQECAKWDADIERGKQALAKRQTDAKTAEIKRGELTSLFPVSTEDNYGTYVRDASYGDRDFRKGKYDVTFHSLTEEEVRTLANKLREETK